MGFFWRVFLSFGLAPTCPTTVLRLASFFRQYPRMPISPYRCLFHPQWMTRLSPPPSLQRISSSVPPPITYAVYGYTRLFDSVPSSQLSIPRNPSLLVRRKRLLSSTFLNLQPCLPIFLFTSQTRPLWSFFFAPPPPPTERPSPVCVIALCRFVTPATAVLSPVITPSPLSPLLISLNPSSPSYSPCPPRFRICTPPQKSFYHE